MSQIARNVFGLPNTDFTSRLVRGKPLRPQKNSSRKFARQIFREVAVVVIFLTGEMNPPLKISP